MKFSVEYDIEFPEEEALAALKANDPRHAELWGLQGAHEALVSMIEGGDLEGNLWLVKVLWPKEEWNWSDEVLTGQYYHGPFHYNVNGITFK
jgi:hypothetical protein